MRHTSQVLLFLVVASSWCSLQAQERLFPRWVVSAGGGLLFRTDDPSSPGGQLRLSRVFQPRAALFLEPGLTWHGYARSSQGGDLCPPGGCPPIRQDGITLLGLELGASYRKSDAENPIAPLASIGLYRSASEGTARTRFGAAAGLVIPFRRSEFGPALDVRYFRIFGDPRFKSIVPVALRWSF